MDHRTIKEYLTTELKWAKDRQQECKKELKRQRWILREINTQLRFLESRLKQLESRVMWEAKEELWQED